MRELDFYGMHFAPNGMSIQAQKLAALRDIAPPRTASEVRSLLGLAQYCTRCIKDLSTTCAPLRELTKDRVPFEWTATHDAALTSLKQALTSDAVAYFKHEWNTVIHVDASPVGLGAILTQENPNNADEKHVVQYASRSLSDVETRYHQTEREALAVVWAMEHFYLYVYGGKFEIVTDNTAVATVFNDPRSKPKARLENWGLRLQRYDFSIRHMPGKYNIADYLSRQPTPATAAPTDDPAEAYINQVVDSVLPAKWSRESVVAASNSDSTLAQVKLLIKGRPNTAPPAYQKCASELTTTSDGLVLHGNLLVVPVAMR